MLKVFLFVFILGLTVVFSFLPERYLKPLAVKRSYKSIILQSLVVTMMFLAVTLIVQRPIFSALAVGIFLIILSGVSNAKYHALREPLVFSDIAMFSQAFKHPRLYFPFLGLWPVLIMPIVIIALIYALFKFEPAMPFTWSRMLGTFVLIVLCFFIAKKIATDIKLSEDPAIDNTQYGLLNSLFTYTIQARSPEHQQRIKEKLEQSPFAINKAQTGSKKAPPHFYEVFNDAKGKLHPLGQRRDNPSLSQHSLGSAVFPAGTTPNITVIQSESFFDARRMHTSINRNVLKNYDICLNESAIHGKLSVPAWGANTMRTEFSFLTGLEYEEMGLYRYYPYQYVHKMPITSLAKLLQSQGYHCVCIHPHPASFFGRDRIFPHMGFDEFMDIQSFANKETFGPYIADQTVTEKILEVSNKNNDRPLFIFAITMENHGPLHLEKTTKNEQASYFSKVPITQANDLTVYLRHLKNADKMIKELTSAFEQSEQANTLCFYGDHIPSMPNIYQQLAYEDRDSDYFIWNNHKTKHKAKRLDISVDGLAQMLLAQTGNIS